MLMLATGGCSILLGGFMAVFFLGEKKEKKVLQVKFVPPCELWTRETTS